MPYVDGFVVAVPKSKVGDYKKLARKHGKVWREHGALAYVECLGDDVPYGKNTSFPPCGESEGQRNGALLLGHLQIPVPPRCCAEASNG